MVKVAHWRLCQCPKRHKFTYGGNKYKILDALFLKMKTTCILVDGILMPCILRRPAIPSVSRSTDSLISSRNRALSPVSNLRADSPAGYNNGMEQRRYKHFLMHLSSH